MERYHYLDLPDKQYYSGYGSDDGYDAIKDANAEMGLEHDSPVGISRAKRLGWIRVKSEDTNGQG